MQWSRKMFDIGGGGEFFSMCVKHNNNKLIEVCEVKKFVFEPGPPAPPPPPPPPPVPTSMPWYKRSLIANYESGSRSRLRRDYNAIEYCKEYHVKVDFQHYRNKLS